MVTHRVKYCSREEISPPASLGSCSFLHFTLLGKFIQVGQRQLSYNTLLEIGSLFWHYPSPIPILISHWIGYRSCFGLRLSQYTTTCNLKSSPPSPPIQKKTLNPPHPAPSLLIVSSRTSCIPQVWWNLCGVNKRVRSQQLSQEKSWRESVKKDFNISSPKITLDICSRAPVLVIGNDDRAARSSKSYLERSISPSWV